MSGDDRFGGSSGETLYINFDKRDEFKRLLVFVYIYDGTPAFDRTHAKIEIFPGSGPRIEIPLSEREPQARSCAVGAARARTFRAIRAAPRPSRNSPKIRSR